MPVAIANSLSPFDVPDARSLRPSSSSIQSAHADSRRFVEALNEAQREPSRTIERKPLPPVDEPLDLVKHADDVELRAAQAASPASDSSSSPSPSSPSPVDPSRLHVAGADRQPAQPDPKLAERLRRRSTDSSSSSSSSSLPTSAAAKLAIRAAGSDALLQAVQHHVRVSVQNEARQGAHSDERAAKLQSTSTAAFTTVLPPSAETPVEVQPPLNLQTTPSSTSSSTAASTAAIPEAMSMAPRESAALEHVQAMLDDPASQLFFDGRRAVLTIDGMTMRITSTADGQASVEMTAADAAAATRLQAHRAELVEGLQQEGIALTKLEVGHEAGASTSHDRRREHPEPVEFAEEPRKAVTTSTAPTAPTAPTLRAGVIKA